MNNEEQRTVETQSLNARALRACRDFGIPDALEREEITMKRFEQRITQALTQARRIHDRIEASHANT